MTLYKSDAYCLQNEMLRKRRTESNNLSWFHKYFTDGDDLGEFFLI